MRYAYTLEGAGLAQEKLQQLAELGGTVRPVLVAGATAAARAVRANFTALEQQPNAHGWPKSGFYAREGTEKTSVGEITETEATVNVASPAMAHRFHGGVITPKRGKFLTIPLTPLAYMLGSPRQGGWEERGEKLFIPEGRRVLATRVGGNFTPQYALVRSVTQPPDPAVLPSAEELAAATTPPMASALDRQLRRLGGARS